MKDQSKVDVLVGNTLIDMYTKCGCLNDAHKVFFDLPDRDVVSWGTIISGYQQLEDDFAAPLIPFEMMQEENVEPDLVIILSILKSCSSIGALNCGRLLHDHVIRNGLESDFGVGNTLVDMYVNCGSLREGEVMFDRLANRNVVSWNAMIGGYAQHGYGELALQWFESMRLQSITPTYYTYISILAACSQSGEVEEGYRHFRAMYNSHKITPGDEHFNCMVNLLGHVGRLDEAEELLKSMPFLPDISGWMSLLTACSLFGNKDLGRRCLGEVARLTPDTYSGLDILVFNIWAEKGIHSAECEEQFTVW
jgi:pentatricopeptide repeat protein